jgi:hypothetical protein
LFVALPVASLVVAASPAVTFADDPPAASGTPSGGAAAGGASGTATPADCGSGFLGIRPWYYGLADPAADCAIKAPSSSDSNALGTFIWAIVLNCIDIALTLAAYVAIVFIIYGGFLFITGSGVATQIERARKTIFNAVIGLVVAMGAIGIVRFVFNAFGSAASGETANGFPKFTAAELLHNGLNTVYFLGGLITVLVIIIAGINYATSGGDSGKVSKAKNTLTYAIVGLVIILAAFAITNFIMRSFAQ